MNILFRILAGAALVALVAPAVVACADTGTSRYGAPPVISGVPSGYDTRKEEARGR